MWGPEDYMGLPKQACGNACNYNQAHVAAQFDDPQMLNLASAGELSGRDIEGKLPAHYAVQKGSLSVLRLLTERRADLASPDLAGRTPLDMLDLLPDAKRAPVREALLGSSGEGTTKAAGPASKAAPR